MRKAWKEGISPIITIVLMALIVFMLIGFALIFVASLQTSGLESAAQQEEALVERITPFVIENVQGTAIHVRNVASQPIANTTLALYVDNQEFNITTSNLDPSVITTINLSTGVIPAGTYDFKLSSSLAQASQQMSVAASNVLKEPAFQDQPRDPFNIVLVIDRSGSMDDDCGPDRKAQPGETPCKINDAKTAAIAFVDLTSPIDKLAEVSFSTAATLDQALTFDKQTVKDAIDSLSARGWTAIGDGINTATTELGTDTREAKKLQILLGDGAETRNSDPLGRAAEAALQDITIHTIGLGAGADEVLMQQIANTTGGLYFFAPTNDDLLPIFAQIGEELGASWISVGSVGVDSFGDICFSPDRCSNFTGGVYPDTVLYQNTRILFPGTYNVEASAHVFTNGGVCSNACASLPGETCSDNDARIHLIALDALNNVLSESTGQWASGSGWDELTMTWTTPANTKTVRFQIDAGDCCASCSAEGVYVDDTRLIISKP